MNFKALALGTVLTLGSIFGTVAPASAGTCWFENNYGSLSPSYCSTNQRVNNNGHTVLDVVDYQGTKLTFVFWDDNTVELVSNGGVTNGIWWTDSQGDRRIETSGGEMAIRL